MSLTDPPRQKRHFFRHVYVRLTLANTVVFSLLVLGLLVYWYVYTRQTLLHEAAAFLKHETSEITAHMDRLSLSPAAESWIQREISENSDYSMGYLILDEKNTPVSSFETERTGLSMDRLRRLGSEAPEKGVRIRQINMTWDEMSGAGISRVTDDEGRTRYVVVLGAHFDYVHRKLHSYRKRIMIALPLVFAASLLMGSLLSSIAFGPVRRMIVKMENISAKSLNERIPLRGAGDDLDRLAATFNVMMDRIRESYEKITRFTSDAAHELKTPLSILKTQIEVTLTQERRSEEYRETLAGQLEELERLSELVDKMLLLARSEAGTVLQNGIPVDLEEVLDDITDFYEPVFESAGISLTRNISGPVFVHGDPVLLHHVFSNLIDNALRYAGKGSVISVRAFRKDGLIHVCIHDTGPGIPREDQARVFERFYRIGTTRHNGRSSHGLGLAICKAIVEAHSGTLRLESAPGKGTAFFLEFPLVPK